MRLEVAKNRITEVLRADTMTTSKGDFFATHVPLQNIEIYTKFDPNDAKKSVKFRSKDVSEDYIFKNIILNPEDKHQFILVMGESGAGKSHLIRWYNACLENYVRENEIVLFIRRNDNTLKGTIKQLLQHDEIKGLNNKELYERLLKATAVVSESMLKNEILSKFRIHIQDDLDTDDTDEEQLTYTDKKRLIAFLKYSKIEEKLKEINGPIDRIYSKIAQSDKVMSDINAMFEVKDFNIDDDENIDLLNDIIADADRDTKALANKINTDPDYKEKITNYLNSFLDKVIQSCSGLQAGDFEEIFMEIRRNLRKQGKSLTILIEDITSFTGVNIELLNALTTEHTGQGNQDLCRISSVIGITSGYFKDHFKANYRDRTTLFVYLKNNIFSEEYLYEFVGKYLNAMSISNDEIEAWAKGGALPEQYPIHKIDEGENWDYYEMPDGRKLNLYPFTKYAIINLYNYRLSTEQLKTPRYILQYIIEPVVRDILVDQVAFPNVKELANYNGNPSTLLRSKIFDSQSINKEDKERMFLFMCLWGDGSDKIEIRNDKKFISGISEEVYKELNLPILDNLQKIKMTDVSVHKSEEEGKKVVQGNTIKPMNSEIIKNNQKVQKIIAILEDWLSGGIINVGTTTGNEAILSRARDNIIKYIQSAINWQIEGVALDNLKKVNDSKFSLIGFERQARGNYLVELKANRQTQKIVEAFVRWEVEGNNSWNFDNGDYYALAVEIWTEQIKSSIIEALNYSKGKNVNYKKFAIALEMYRQLIFGQIRGKWNFYKSNTFFENDVCNIDTSSEHSREWISLQEQIKRIFDQIDPRKTALQCYNLIQGKGGNKIYLDRTKFDKDFIDIKKSQLSLEDIKYEDDIKGRGEIEEQFNNISAKIDTAYNAERNKIIAERDTIEQILGCNTMSVEEISDLLANAQSFYDEVGNAKLYAEYPALDSIKRNKNKISEALSSINEILSNNDVFDNLILMSHDPLKAISGFTKFIKKLKDDIERIDNQMKKEENRVIEETGHTIRDPYQDERDTIDECDVMMRKLG